MPLFLGPAWGRGVVWWGNVATEGTKPYGDERAAASTNPRADVIRAAGALRDDVVCRMWCAVWLELYGVDGNAARYKSIFIFNYYTTTPCASLDSLHSIRGGDKTERLAFLVGLKMAEYLKTIQTRRRNKVLLICCQSLKTLTFPHWNGPHLWVRESSRKVQNLCLSSQSTNQSKLHIRKTDCG